MLVSALTNIVRREVRRCLAAVARDVALLAAAGLFAALALIAALFAGYQALLTVWPSYWAAAAIAGGALVLAGIALAVVAGGGRPRRRASRRRAEEDLETIAAALRGDTATLTRSALDEAEARYRSDPAAALAAAAALGLVAGLLWPDDAD